MASSSSSTSRSRRRLPVRRQAKREDEYELPRRYCRHGFVAPRWTLWTEGNPGRRFYGCPKYYQGKSCGYFAWHDMEFGERANMVIKELLDDIDKLTEENRELRREKHGEWLYDEVDSIERKAAALKRRCEIEEIKLKSSEMKFKIVMVALLMTWGWLFYLYWRQG